MGAALSTGRVVRTEIGTGRRHLAIPWSFDPNLFTLER